MATAATASLVPVWSANNGVSKLPMPKPATLAIAPAMSAAAVTTRSNVIGSIV